MQLHFSHLGKAREIYDVTTDQELLRKLGIHSEHLMEVDRKTTKSKHNLLVTPEKDSKTSLCSDD